MIFSCFELFFSSWSYSHFDCCLHIFKYRRCFNYHWWSTKCFNCKRPNVIKFLSQWFECFSIFYSLFIVLKNIMYFWCFPFRIANSGISFGTFMLHMVPACLLVGLCTYLMLRFVLYRKLEESIKDEDIDAIKREIVIWNKTLQSVNSLSREERQVSS